MNSGIVRLSSNFSGIISKAVAKIPKSDATNKIKRSNLPLNPVKITNDTIVILRKKASDPSMVLVGVSLCFPNLMPIIADSGSAMANE